MTSNQHLHETTMSTGVFETKMAPMNEGPTKEKVAERERVGEDHQNSKVQDLKNQLELAQKELLETKSQLETANVKLSDRDSEVMGLRNTICCVLDKNQQFYEKIQKLKMENQAEIDGKKIFAKKLFDENYQLRVENGNLEYEILERDLKIDDLEFKLEGIEASYATSKKQEKVAQHKLIEKEKKIQELQKNSEDVEKKLKEATERLDRLRYADIKINVRNQKIQKLEEELQDLKKKEMETVTQLQTSRAEQKKLEQLNQTWRRHFEKLQNNKTETRNQSGVDNSNQRYQRQLDGQGRAMYQLQKSNQEKQREIEQLRREINAIQARFGLLHY